MGQHFLVCLGLLCGFPRIIQAQIAQTEAIGGPDGRGPAPLAPRPSQPSLEDQLRRKKKLLKEQPEAKSPAPSQRAMPEYPATGTDELLEPHEKEQIEAMQEQMNLKKIADPRFRMNLGIALPKAKKVAGAIDRWHFDPGAIWETAFRLTDPSRSFTFWTGWRLAAWNGQAQSTETFARFAVQYLGPLFAFEWQGKIRQSVAFGLAGVSRQSDPDFAGNSDQTATKPFGLDGSGLWMSYGLGFRIVPGFDAEAKIGAQSGASYFLTYASLGVSLWVE